MTESAAELVPYQAVDNWIPVLPDVGRLAGLICDTEFVPTSLRRRQAAVAAAILAGRELELGPMASLAHVHVIEGKPSLSAEMQRALVLRAGHEIVFTETSADRCVIAGRRRGTGEWTTVIWTIGDARRAKLDGRPNWQRYPKEMLAARASAQLCRLVFPDIVAGLGSVTVEELQDEQPPSAPATTVPRTTARRVRGTIASPPEAASPVTRPDQPPAVTPKWEEPPTADEWQPKNPWPANIPQAPPDDSELLITPADEPMSAAQSRKLHALLRNLGMDRETGLATIGFYLNRTLTTTKEISRQEAGGVIDWLDRGMPQIPREEPPPEPDAEP